MKLNDIKPLQPLTHGNVLIVGAKASNFERDLIDNPRVILWDSRDHKWEGKDLPYNVRAVFITRWIGHAEFNVIIKEAKKKHITIFNPQGTGMIARQVRELLDLNKKEPTMTETTVPPTDTRTSLEMIPNTPHRGKLKVLIPFLDPNKNYADNAKFLLTKAQELNIQTSFNSLAMFARKYLGKKKTSQVKTRTQTQKSSRILSTKSQTDVSVEILDNMIKELQDMRDYLVAVTEENQKLKIRMEKFKKFLND